MVKSLFWTKFLSNLNVAEILKQMKIHGDIKRFETPVRELIEIVKPMAKPKALIKVVCVDHKTPQTLQIDGVEFDSKLIRVSLDKVETAFVCMTTAGTEIEAMEQPQDVIKRFCLDALKKSSFVRGHGLSEKISPGDLSDRYSDQSQSGGNCLVPN